MIASSAALFSASAAATMTAEREWGDCVVIKESAKRLECYDNRAPAPGQDKSAKRDETCKDSIISRFGGGFFRSFPRQRELW